MTATGVPGSVREAGVPVDGMPVPARRRSLASWWDSLWGRRMLVEVAIVGGLFLVYKQVRFLVRDEQLEAMANARKVVRWERALGLFNELDLQELVLRSQGVVQLLNNYYVSVHFPVTLAVVVWAYVRHRSTAYAALKFVLISVTAVSLVIHVAFPLAPPRMLGHLGFVDTLAEFGPRIYPDDPGQSVANQFAAMPSLHFGWALIIAWSVSTTVRRGWAQLAWIHPGLTLIAITATANHFWLDSIVVAALVVMAMLAWWAVQRRLPRAGSFSGPGRLATAAP